MKNNQTNQPASIQFLGGTETVTGSKTLLEAGGLKILIDCGLFQGLKKFRLLNWTDLPFDVSQLDVVILTHGHLDHCGYLPLLVKQGYNGPIMATVPTIEIAKLILQDSARIQEEDAALANEQGYSKHEPAKPLYTEEEALLVFPQFHPKEIHKWIPLNERVSFRMRPNGHIIGSVFIELKVDEQLIVFSGDIGRTDDELMEAPEKPDVADVLCIESTYGNRIHPKGAMKELEDAINKAVEKNGSIIIPSFAVERSQLMMYLLYQLLEQKRIPDLPVYFDSPMGIHVIDIFMKNPGWHKLDLAICERMCQVVKRIKDREESLALIQNKFPKIVIAGGGMASGGRVLSYFEKYLADPAATILFVGYQAEGTRGRAMIDGAKEIKLHGKYYKIKAEVGQVHGLSAHADQTGLINWLSGLKKMPRHLFINHGEADGAIALKGKINAVYGYKAEIPELFHPYTL